LPNVGDDHLRSSRSDTERDGAPVALSGSGHKDQGVAEQPGVSI
jgi:hypothetical protein